MSAIMTDYATQERKSFINKVSPFHMYELDIKCRHYGAWVLNLIFGMPMPHERR